MVTITPSERFTPYSPVVPTTVFAVGFPILDNADVVLMHNGSVVAGAIVSGTYAEGVSTNAIITAPVGLVGAVQVVGQRVPQRTSQYSAGKPLPISDHNYALNRVEMEIQETRRETNRSLKFAVGTNVSDMKSLPLPERGKALVGNAAGDGYINAPIAEGDIAVAVEEAEAARNAAVVAKDIAAQKADISTSEAAQSKQERIAAELAAQIANTAKDAAFVNAAVYLDITSGLAATTKGQQFQVVSGDEIIRYRNDSGSAVEVARYTSAEALDPLQKSNRSIFAVADGDGNLALDIQSPLKIDQDGSVEVDPFRVISRPGKWRWGVADSDGNILVGVNSAGKLIANLDIPLPVEPDTSHGGPLFDYSVNGVFCYGQSLSVGQASPLLSTTALYDTLMFEYGMRPQYDYPYDEVNWYDSLVPAVEATSPIMGVLRETPSRGTADAINELILAENSLSYMDHEYQILVSNPGWGATTILQLSKGSSHYSRMIAQAEAGLQRANEGGQTFALQAITWVQGESDYLSATPYSTYLALLDKLVSDIQEDVKVATGQPKRVVVIGSQIASHIHGASDDVPDIAIAQLECSRTNPDFYLSGAMYHLPYQDGFHLTGVGSRWLGGYLGLAYKRIIIDGQNWKPLQPITLVRQGSVVEVRFHVPHGHIEFDTIGMAVQTNMGFELVNGAGEPLVISGVQIIDRDRIRITSPSPIQAGSRLRYAWQGDTARGLGNLRDTQGDEIVFDPTGINKPLHNWCVIFEEELS